SPTSTLFPYTTLFRSALSFAVLTFSVTSFAQASGLLAVYVMAILLGNSDLTYRHSIVRFHEGFAWMMQILMFILLGLLVFPENRSEEHTSELQSRFDI